MSLAWSDFLISSGLMGLAIGIDVALATVARANQFHTVKLALFWLVGVSLTHTIFPMVGYLLAYFSVQLASAAAPFVGIIAFTCIFIYLKDELSQISDNSADANNNQLLVTLGLILAVSWDALWSGPAKSAQVIGWSEVWVWASFILVGVVVAVLALLSVQFAAFINKLSEQYPTINIKLSWLQYSVIAYFGLLALVRYTLQLSTAWWQLLLVSLLTMAGLLRYVSKTKASDRMSRSEQLVIE